MHKIPNSFHFFFNHSFFVCRKDFGDYADICFQEFGRCGAGGCSASRGRRGRGRWRFHPSSFSINRSPEELSPGRSSWCSGKLLHGLRKQWLWMNLHIHTLSPTTNFLLMEELFKSTNPNIRFIFSLIPHFLKFIILMNNNNVYL